MRHQKKKSPNVNFWTNKFNFFMLKVSSSLQDEQYLSSFPFLYSFVQSMIFSKLRDRVFIGKIIEA